MVYSQKKFKVILEETWSQVYFLVFFFLDVKKHNNSKIQYLFFTYNIYYMTALPYDDAIATVQLCSTYRATYFYSRPAKSGKLWLTRVFTCQSDSGLMEA